MRDRPESRGPNEAPATAYGTSHEQVVEGNAESVFRPNTNVAPTP